jgi:hypothetical protein
MKLDLQSTKDTEGVDKGRHFTLAIRESVGEVCVDADGRHQDAKLR